MTNYPADSASHEVELLKGALQTGNLIIFIGAGLSVGAGLPGWIKLIRPLAAAVSFKLGEDENLIGSERLLKAAQYYENQHGRNNLIAHLRKELSTIDKLPTDVHRLIASLPVRTIITTNYDDLIEQALREEGQEPNTIIQKQDMPFLDESAVTVVKLAGSLSVPDSILITQGDFDTYFTEQSYLADWLRVTIQSKHALFLGYSLQDPFFHQIWAEIGLDFGKYQRPGYTVMFEIDQLEIDELRRRHIHVIKLETEDGANKTEVLLDWLRQIKPEVEGWGKQALMENLRNAKKSHDQPGIALSLYNLGLHFHHLGELKEARKYYDQSLAKYRDLADERNVGILLFQRAMVEQQHRDFDGAHTFLAECLTINRNLKNQFELAQVLYWSGVNAQLRGSLDEARQFGAESLAINERTNNRYGISANLSLLASIAHQQNEIAEARRIYEQLLEIAKAAGDQNSVSGYLNQLAGYAHQEGNLEEARRLYQESLEISRAFNNQLGVAGNMFQLAIIAQQQGNLSEAWELLSRNRDILKSLGGQAANISLTLYQLAAISLQRGDPKEARQLINEGLKIARKIENLPGIATGLARIGVIARLELNAEEARRALNEALAIFRELENEVAVAAILYCLGNIAQQQGQAAEARQFFVESLNIFRELDNPFGMAHNLYQLRLIAEQQGNVEEARRFYDESMASYQKLYDLLSQSFLLPGAAASTEGRITEAQKFYAWSPEIDRDLDDEGIAAEILFHLGTIAQQRGELAKAEQLFDESKEKYLKVGDQLQVAENELSLGLNAEKKNNGDEAARQYRAALSIFEELKSERAVVAREHLQRVEQKI